MHLHRCSRVLQKQLQCVVVKTIASAKFGNQINHDEPQVYADQKDQKDKVVAKKSKMKDALFNGRNLFLTGEFNTAVTNNILQKLVWLSMNKPKDPIHLHLDGYSNEFAADSLAIHDMIKAIESPVYIWSYGIVYHVAPLIMAAGEKGHRLALPTTTFSLANHSYVKVGTEAAVVGDEVWSKKIKQKLIDCFVEATGQSSRTIARDLSVGKTLTAHEALSYGLIDRVVAAETYHFNVLPPAEYDEKYNLERELVRERRKELRQRKRQRQAEAQLPQAEPATIQPAATLSAESAASASAEEDDSESLEFYSFESTESSDPKTAESTTLGSADSAASGPAKGTASGPADGASSGPADGASSGPADGASSGPDDGAPSGPADAADSAASGPAKGTASGPADGASFGPADGASSRPAEGASSGPADGASSGPADGASSEPADDADRAASEPADGTASRSVDSAAPANGNGPTPAEDPGKTAEKGADNVTKTHQSSEKSTTPGTASTTTEKDPLK